MNRWKMRAEELRTQVYTIYLACKDPRVPWHAKAIIFCIVGYVFSPIDLIPDFVPILGYLDELIVIPLGVILVSKMIPRPILDECRIRAQELMNRDHPRNWTAAVIVIGVWLSLAVLATIFVVRVIRKNG